MKYSEMYRCLLLLSVLIFHEALLDGAPNVIEKPNVLFIAVDDLRPALGCYDDPLAKTPNIDRLAKRGMIFTRAYCQEGMCNPSRASLMTGRYPDTIRVWDLTTHFRDTLPDVVTLPQHFKNNGYDSRSIGKIYHGTGRPHKDPPSWSAPAELDRFSGFNASYALKENQTGRKAAAVECIETADDRYRDGKIANRAVEKLRELANGKKPFFPCSRFHETAPALLRAEEILGHA